MANFLEVLNAVTASLGGIASIANQTARQRQQDDLAAANLLTSTGNYTLEPATQVQPPGILAALGGSLPRGVGGAPVIRIGSGVYQLTPYKSGLTEESLRSLLGTAQGAAATQATTPAPPPLTIGQMPALPAQAQTPRQPAVTTPPPQAQTTTPLAPTFLAKAQQTAQRLGMPFNNFLAIMDFETGGTFSPAVRNPQSKATGLIQFLPKTAEAMGTNIATLAQMTNEQQLDYVEQYFAPYKGSLGNLQDAYMAVLYPRAIGKAPTTILFRQGEEAYRQNAGLDTDKKGYVTVADAVARVSDYSQRARAASLAPSAPPVMTGTAAAGTPSLTDVGQPTPPTVASTPAQVSAWREWNQQQQVGQAPLSPGTTVQGDLGPQAVTGAGGAPQALAGPTATALPPQAAAIQQRVAQGQGRLIPTAFGDMLPSMAQNLTTRMVVLRATLPKGRQGDAKFMEEFRQAGKDAAQTTREFLTLRNDVIKANPAYREYLMGATSIGDLDARLRQTPGGEAVNAAAFLDILSAGAMAQQNNDWRPVAQTLATWQGKGVDAKALEPALDASGYTAAMKAQQIRGTTQAEVDKAAQMERQSQEIRAQYGAGVPPGMHEALYVVAQEKKQTIPEAMAQSMPEVVAKKMELLEKEEKVKLAQTPLDAASTLQVNNILYSHKALTLVDSAYSKDEIKQYVGLISGTASKYGSILTDLKRQVFGAGGLAPSDALRAQYMQTVDKAINEAGQTLQKTNPSAAERYFQFAADAKRIEELAFFRGGQQLTGNEIAIMFGILPTLQDAAGGNFLAKLASSKAHTQAQIAQMQKTLGMGRGNAGQVLRDLSQDITTAGADLARQRDQGQQPSGASWRPQPPGGVTSIGQGLLDRKVPLLP